MRGFAFLCPGVLCLMTTPGFADDVDGAALFENYCAACHGSGGVGTPGLAPALNRPEFWQQMGEDAPTYILGVVTRGLVKPITVNGERFMAMPPVAGPSDLELAQIASWVLDDLGEVRDVNLSGEDVAAARKSGPTGDDLIALRPETE
jgi:mono/diheme cytochrome c family protein